MPGPRSIVIVGASMAGGTAAATLREEGFEGGVVLIGAEPEPPYERPPLSKEYLRGESTIEDAYVRPSSFWEEHDVETRFGVAATGVDPGGRRVLLAGGEEVAYDRLLIATGVRNRRLPIPGIDLGGVYELRSVADAERIRGEIEPGRRAAVVGAGFIGSEVAASLRTKGLEVTLIEMAELPLAHALGPEVGRALAAMHRDHGVRMLLGQATAAFEGSGRVERVVRAGGDAVECDFAVAGLGVEPVTDFLRGSGIRVDDGIVVDEYCRTSVEGVYAAGDVARHYHPLARAHVRVEHWQNAMNQGRHAALSMLDRAEPYEDVHWFWSDQYDSQLQWAGFPGPWDDMVVRGSLEDRRFAVFYLKAGRMVSASSLDHPRDVRRAMKAIAAGVAVDPDLLRDKDIDLRTLANNDA